MKYIKSTLGTNIEFLLSKGRKINIETTIPVEVTDEEFTILENRLGHQIQEVVIGKTDTNSDETIEEENETVETETVETPTDNEVVVDENETV